MHLNWIAEDLGNGFTRWTAGDGVYRFTMQNNVTDPRGKFVHYAAVYVDGADGQPVRLETAVRNTYAAAAAAIVRQARAYAGA